MALHWLIRGWLGHAVRQKAAEAVADAVGKQGARTQRSRQGDAADSGPPAPADVGIVFALGHEAGGFVDRLREVIVRRGAGFVTHEGSLAGLRVVAATSGPGRVSAGRATEAILLGHRPRCVISAGFAGGLDATVRRGDLFMADSLVDSSGRILPVDVDSQWPDAHTTGRWHTGRLLTVDRIVNAPEEKRRLGNRYAAQAVDMETYGVAEVCRQRNVLFLAVRVITDTLEDRLPDEVDQLMRQETLAARAGAVTGAIWRRPSSVKDLWHLQQTALQASDRLAGSLEEIVAQLHGGSA